MLKVCDTRYGIYIGNTIDYDMKAYQVRMTIVKTYKCTTKRING